MQAVYNILQDGSGGASELLDLAEGYVKEGSWRELMQPLLPLLPEDSLLQCCTHALPATSLGEQSILQASNSGRGHLACCFAVDAELVLLLLLGHKWTPRVSQLLRPLHHFQHRSNQCLYWDNCA